MVIYIISAYSILISASIFYGIIKYKKIYDNNKILNKVIIKLKSSLDDELDDIDLREGFYIENQILSDDEHDPNAITSNYSVVVHILELEKYKNGYSKIKINYLDSNNGYNPSQYNYINDITRKRFNTIVLTSDITWLDKNIDLNKLRKKKITSILTEITNMIEKK